MTVHATHDQSRRVISLAASISPQANMHRPLDVRHLILDVCASHPAQANGVFNVARQLALEQLHAGDTARIMFLCDPDSRPGTNSESVPVTVCPVVAPRVKGRPLFLPSQIESEIVKGVTPSTVFHIHGGRNPLLIYLARALQKRHLRFAVTVHGRYSHVFDEQQRLVRSMPAIYLRWLEGRALASATFVHAVSPIERDILRQLSPNASVEFIANAAYSSALDGTPGVPPRRLPSAQFPTFGYFGRLEIEHKGLDLLVHGFAQYRHRGGRGRLSIFGSGPGLEKLTAIVKEAGVSGSVDLAGPQFDEAKFERLRAWDFLVMPSRFDGMPIAALEAGITGLPLILSPATGLGEHIKKFKAGDVITPLTADGVSEALSRASGVSADDFQRLSLNAYHMALDVGDWTSVAERLRILYESPELSKSR